MATAALCEVKAAREGRVHDAELHEALSNRRPDDAGARSHARPAGGDVPADGPKVGQWKTWLLTSATEIEVPAPPAATSQERARRAATAPEGSFVDCQHHYNVISNNGARAPGRRCSTPTPTSRRSRTPGTGLIQQVSLGVIDQS